MDFVNEETLSSKRRNLRLDKYVFYLFASYYAKYRNIMVVRIAIVYVAELGILS